MEENFSKLEILKNENNFIKLSITEKDNQIKYLEEEIEILNSIIKEKDKFINSFHN